MHSQNYKMLMKETEDDREGKIYHVLRLEESILSNDYIQGNLQIQCNSDQITKGIFHRSRREKILICNETQRTQSP